MNGLGEVLKGAWAVGRWAREIDSWPDVAGRRGWVMGLKGGVASHVSLFKGRGIMGEEEKKWVTIDNSDIEVVAWVVSGRLVNIKEIMGDENGRYSVGDVLLTWSAAVIRVTTTHERRRKKVIPSKRKEDGSGGGRWWGLCSLRPGGVSKNWVLFLPRAFRARGWGAFLSAGGSS